MVSVDMAIVLREDELRQPTFLEGAEHGIEFVRPALAAGRPDRGCFSGWLDTDPSSFFT